jgi:signal transduction histidine kinase
VVDRDIERKAQVAEILLNVARELGEGLEPERVYERFHELLGEVIEHDGLVISSYEPAEELIRCDYLWNEGNVIDPATLPALRLNREGGGMQSRVIVSGMPFLFNDVAQEIREHEGVYYNVDREGGIERIPDGGPPRTKSAMMVPVKHEGGVVGVVQLMSDRGEYTTEQVELFEALVAQMAAAVRNARLQRERRRLEAAEAAARAAAAEREQAAQVLEAIGDGVFLLDDEGLVRLWNRAAELLTGLPTSQMRDTALGNAIPEWPEIALRIPIAQGRETPRPVTVPVRVGSRDLWLSFVAVRSAAGVIYAFRDLSDEMRLEEEKSDFVTTISHELRTPMTAVYGAAATLLHRDRDLEEDLRRQLLEMLAAEAKRLADITEEVLLTSQLDHGDLRIEREPIDVPAVVQTTVATIASQLQDSVAIEVHVPADLPPASGDADRLRQVLVNLLDNAVKYSGAREVSVRVKAKDSLIQIAVADRGPGIAFGLYISRELVRRMGGSLDVESEPGRGAIFTITLPRVQSTALPS